MVEFLNPVSKSDKRGQNCRMPHACLTSILFLVHQCPVNHIAESSPVLSLPISPKSWTNTQSFVTSAPSSNTLAPTRETPQQTKVKSYPSPQLR
ncbi:hypothetical protein HYQ46_012537 [Verticillium longisporum]|nr:hypothetical protein HYQ46_012537 [Verticillium longisporum]